MYFRNCVISHADTHLIFTCSKSAIETLEEDVKYVQSVFIVTFEHISHLFLVFLSLTLNK